MSSLVIQRDGRALRSSEGRPERVVHVAPLPIGVGLAGLVGTLCGALLRFDQVEAVAPGVGVGCTRCLLHSVNTPPTPTPTGYQEWGWPVVVFGEQVLLILGVEARALMLPTGMADAVTTILASRDRPAAVLDHPCAPEHWLVLVGEPFGAALPWPDGVHTISGAVPLPPTVTAFGSVRWLQPPHDPDLATCREIDVFAAVRTALRDVAQVEGGRS